MRSTALAFKLFSAFLLSSITDLGPLGVSAQAPSPNFTVSLADAILTTQVDEYINKVLGDWGTNGGVAVDVVRLDSQGNAKIETKGYGKDRIDGTKVTENTIFGIGSNSKVCDC